MFAYRWSKGDVFPQPYYQSGVVFVRFTKESGIPVPPEPEAPKWEAEAKVTGAWSEESGAAGSWSAETGASGGWTEESAL